jgi:TonB family protein
MPIVKTLPILFAGLAILPAQAIGDGVGRADNSAQKQISIDLKSCAKPVWPKESLRREETGRVTLEFLIALDGKVLESKVIESSGHPLLDFAAQDGLAKCQFTPPSSVGRTQPTRTKMQYVWVMEPGKSAAEIQAAWQRTLAAAEQGDPSAQYRAAIGYLVGKPVAADNAQAMHWLRASAEQGHVPAMESLAMELQSGLRIERDLEQAIILLENAVAQGSNAARMRLAMSFQLGLGVQRDETRAQQLLEQAVSAGSNAAKAPLALLLLKPAGDEHARALALLEDGAEAQDRAAQFTLASLYENGEYVPQDKARALALYERVAATGNLRAQQAVQRLRTQD